MPFTKAQQWALVIVPKVTGFISLVFSGLVIYTVCSCKQKRSKTYHRLLLGISCVDVSSSFWLGLSTWPIPKETGILGASGTTASCTLQGFFTQFGVTSSFYNASLSVFYLLVIRYGWKDDQIRKIEPFLHAFPLLWGLSTSIAGLPLTIFNSANLWCWIAPYKDRGENADLFRWILFYGPLWTMILLVTINVMLMFHHVRKLERAAEQHTFRRQSLSFSTTVQPNGFQVQFPLDDDCAKDSVVEEQGESERETGNNNYQGETGEGKQGDLEAVPEAVQPATSPLKSWGGEANMTNSTLGSSRMVNSTVRSSRRKSGLALAVSFRNINNSGNMTESRANKRRRSREVANQSLRYAGSFYFTWIALTLTRLLQAINGNTYFPLLIIAAATTPLQGLPNFLVYLYPRYKKARKEMPNAGVLECFKSSIAPAAQSTERGSRDPA
ncbi:expressed unknown protein [Seminavis robusta]|uniref:G-protein coupled receptors family 2 profile 2 domain-containing protein n=1 Tax=Seminavis robusta TaxID=568900 RepID=A0A9N8EE31_9STRA|nr:expressed unknown protein [Seminavis robusta]|eukprot:Sro1018_g231850.1 n/a (441) ;mRNA; r:21082-22654